MDPTARRASMFSRVRHNDGRRPDATDRPPSARSSFVERLRSMQITQRTQPAARATGTTNAPATRVATETGRCATGKTMDSYTTVRHGGTASRHQTHRAQSNGNISLAASPVRTAPTAPARSRVEPTRCPTTLSGPSFATHMLHRLPARDRSAIAAHNNAAQKPVAEVTQVLQGLRVGITLMTRKPHRFDWCAEMLIRTVLAAHDAILFTNQARSVSNLRAALSVPA